MQSQMYHFLMTKVCGGVPNTIAISLSGEFVQSNPNKFCWVLL